MKIVSKGVLNRSYLFVYSNTESHSPNMDALATSVLRSTVRLPLLQTERQKHTGGTDFRGVTLFDKLHDAGYNYHVLLYRKNKIDAKKKCI